MFACSTYPVDDAFLANIRQEAIDNVKRIRNHCSLALWCGNNECQDVYYGWGNRYNYYKEKGVEEKTTKDFKDMYFRTLPEVVEEYGGGISYRPSSPFAFEDTPSDGVHGDAHYWDFVGELLVYFPVCLSILLVGTCRLFSDVRAVN